MTDEATSKGPGIKIAPGSSERAPFIFTDGCATYGVSGGVVQIELAANTILPDGAGTKTDVVVVAHLRCSPGVAAGLRDTIDKALKMTETDQRMQPIPNAKPH